MWICPLPAWIRNDAVVSCRCSSSWILCRYSRSASTGTPTSSRKARGCEVSTLQATKAGRPVYERLGYRSFGEIQMWERRNSG